ncbi:unnamed protein product, partial [Nesidiocoris tenuis]
MVTQKSCGEERAAERAAPIVDRRSGKRPARRCRTISREQPLRVLLGLAVLQERRGSAPLRIPENPRASPIAAVSGGTARRHRRIKTEQSAASRLGGRWRRYQVSKHRSRLLAGEA